MTTDPLYSFEVPRNLLQAMALFQSSDETRFVLCSTLFELRSVASGHELTLVATDGRRIAVHHDAIASDNLLTALPKSADFSFDLKGVAKLPKSRGVKGAVLTVSIFHKHAEVVCDKYKYKTPLVVGTTDKPATFPAWRQVIPATECVPVDHLPFNLKLMGDFAKASDLLSKTPGVIIRGYGTDKALQVQLTSYRQFYGLLMPLRLEGASGPDALPEWLKPAA